MKSNSISKKKEIISNNSNSLILIKTNQTEKVKEILEKEKKIETIEHERLIKSIWYRYVVSVTYEIWFMGKIWSNNIDVSQQ